MKLSSLMLPLVGVTALFAVACTDGDTIVQPAGQGQTGISVSGTGIAIGEPDVAIITVGVNVERDSVEQAREDAANAQQAIIDSLKANGVDDADIQTVRFSVQPRYNFSRGDRPEPHLPRRPPEWLAHRPNAIAIEPSPGARGRLRHRSSQCPAWHRDPLAEISSPNKGCQSRSVGG